LVEKQREFFLSGATLNLDTRKKQLLALRKLFVDECDALTNAVYMDLRRRPELTHSIEIGCVIVEIDYILEHLKDWASPKHVEKTFLSLLDTPLIVKDPYGVVLIISPWNYPINLLFMPLIPAIAAGNTVILKPSELAPNTTSLISELITKYFDPQYLAVVCGGVNETTELLKERFDHIFYTGGPKVAKSIMVAAARNLTPVTFELGGKCPVVVEEDANIELSAKRIAWGKWMNCGQTCLAPDYILVKSTVKAKLIAALQSTVVEFYGEVPQKSEDYSRIINQMHFDRLNAILEKSAASIVYKGGEPDRGDLFIPPVILEASPDDPVMQEEIFGPLLPVVTVEGLSEAIDFIKSREKPLAAYIFTKNDKDAERFYTETSSGAVCVNDVIMHLTVDTLPFGGVGNSGMGRYRGKFGFDTFTHEKAVLKRAFFTERLIEFVSVTFFCKLYLSYVANILLKKGL
uniref:Aldehyde dehydrogenase n=1 Tax=Enterobius vermicularis TaxID=51028 RepID=A0A0N4V6Q3_ENTVE